MNMIKPYKWLSLATLPKKFWARLNSDSDGVSLEAK